MNEIAQLMDKLTTKEGITETNIPGVRVFKSSKSVEKMPMLHHDGIIIVGQGSKRMHFGDHYYEYNSDNYLVLPVALPTECETFAEPGKPVLAILLDIELHLLHSIFKDMDTESLQLHRNHEKSCTGIFLSPVDDNFLSSLHRILKALQSPLESKILGESLKKELIFQILCKDKSSSLYSLATKDSQLWQLNKALQFIHQHYQERIEVDTLASMVHLSNSAFHRTFKAVTSSSPIQYLKKVRLNTAKDMLLDGNLQIGEAARLVGYDSPTQFTREFKSYFGKSPSVLIKQLRNNNVSL